MLKRYLPCSLTARLFALLVVALPQFAAADDVQSTENAALSLQLDVSINGQPTDWSQLSPTSVTAALPRPRTTRRDRHRGPRGKAPDDLVPLNDLRA
jgi:hypothetical protein